MLPASFALPAAVVRARTTVVGRAWQVLLLLGGFLVLAFILGGQAHADSPDSRSDLSVSNPRPAAVESVARGAECSAKSDAAQADGGMAKTVAAATGGHSVPSVTGLISTVQTTVWQVTSPVTPVVHPIGTGPGGSHHGAVGGHGSVRRADGPARAGAWSFAPVSRAGLQRSARDAMRSATHPAGGTRPQAPGRSPGSTPQHPVESDGSAHHEGGACAAFYAAGTRFHLDAVMRTTHGPAPVQRASGVSVQPD